MSNNEKLTTRRKNLQRGDAFIKNELKFNADAAYGRLSTMRRNMSRCQAELNQEDMRDMPSDLVERYEELWAKYREIEEYEAGLVKEGE